MTEGPSSTFRRPRLGSGTVTVLTWFVLALLAVGAVLFVAWIYREGAGAAGRRPAARPGESSVRKRDQHVAIEPPAAGSLPDPASLAGGGSFGEAVHALLLHAIRDLDRRVEKGIRDSLTSREVLVSLRLASEARLPFERLVGRVERGIFGTTDLAGADYEESVDDYRTFRRSLHGGRG